MQPQISMLSPRIAIIKAFLKVKPNRSENLSPLFSRVPYLESQIDQLVYQLYDLTPEEIAIVEQATQAELITKLIYFFI